MSGYLLWDANIVNFILLDAVYFCIPINIPKLFLDTVKLLENSLFLFRSCFENLLGVIKAVFSQGSFSPHY